MHDYTGKTVFVAGGTSGINFAIAEGFGKAGARVFVDSRKDDNVRAAVEKLAAIAPEAAGTTADVRDLAAVEAAFATCVEKFGEIDVLISGAALAVAVQIAWRLSNVETPVVEIMGSAALLNLGANLVCLRLLYPYRNSDVNMSSVWECSRNDVMEGFAVIAAAVAVWGFGSGWPDILIAIALLILFMRSASRVLRGAWRELYPAPSPN